MRVVIQRVSQASVSIENRIISKIDRGLLLFLGIEDSDGNDDIEWLSSKITQMRVFSDHEGKMNLSLKDIDGEVLLISQFTLHASTKKGNRPSYIKASKPEIALRIYERFTKRLPLVLGKEIKTGIFGADMKVHLLNDGPVTIIIDSKSKE